MKPDTPVKINAGTIAAMTVEQFLSLKKNICAEGQWETAVGLRVSGGGDYIGVEPLELNKRVFGESKDEVRPIMFIGIEKDGYTHS